MDALEHDLRVSEQNLDSQLARKEKIALAEQQDADRRFATPPPSEPKKTAPGTRPSPAPRAAHPASPTPPAEGEAASEGSGPYLVGSPCDMACRALGSMRRSAERLCVLAGTDHPRCQQASTRVATAQERVKQAGCLCVAREQ